MVIKSNIPGRVRLQEERLYRNEELSQVMQLLIKTIQGVRAGHVNPVIGTVVVEYDPASLNVEALQKKIEWMLAVDPAHFQSIRQYYRGYFADELRLRQARQRMFFFGGLYLLLRVKIWVFGRFVAAESLPVLYAAATITIVMGYPLLRRGYREIGAYFPTVSDQILLLIGTGLTFVREGSKGVLLLFLKAWIDSLRAISTLQIKKVMLESNSNPFALVWLHPLAGEKSLVPLSTLQAGDRIVFYQNEPVLVDGSVEEGEAEVNCVYWNGQPEIRHITGGDRVYNGMVLLSGKLRLRVEQVPDLQPKPDELMENLLLYERVRGYRERVIYLAAGISAASCFVTGQILGPLAVLLVMTPAAVELALTSGLTNYLKLLLQNNIVLRNLNTIEKIRGVKQLVFDKTGTLTQVRIAGQRVDEELLPGAAEAIRRLKTIGVHDMTILSGDTDERVAGVARTLEIGDYYAGRSPEEKAEFVRQQRAEGPVVMVGDGVNDLPAMKEADVSITFRDASGPAVTQADCVLLERRLELVAKLFELTEESYTVMEQNIRSGQFYSLGYGLLSAIGKISLIQAESLQVLNSIFSIVNSCRISHVDSSAVCQVLYPFFENHPAKWDARKTEAFLTGNFSACIPPV